VLLAFLNKRVLLKSVIYFYHTQILVRSCKWLTLPVINYGLKITDMNALKYLLLLLITLLLICCNTSKETKSLESDIIIDDMGYKFTFGKTPQKIVVLAPNLTEIVYELGLQNKLIGNTTYCNYPEEAKNIEKIGDMLSIDHEKLLTLQPDLIFITVEGNTKETFDKLKSLGLSLFISNPRDYNGIKKTFRDFGKIFRVSELVENKISGWDKTVDSIKIVSRKHPKYVTMFLVSFQPVMAAGKNTYINQYLTFCNLENITGDIETNYPFLSREEVLKRNPEIILHTQHSYDTRNNVLDLYKEWKDLKAVNNNKVFYLNPDIYFRPGPRFVVALKDLSSLITSQ